MKRVLALCVATVSMCGTWSIYATEASKTAVSKVTRQEVASFLTTAKTRLKGELDAIKSEAKDLKERVKQQLEFEGYSLSAEQKQQLDTLRKQAQEMVAQLKAKLDKGLQKLSRNTKEKLKSKNSSKKSGKKRSKNGKKKNGVQAKKATKKSVK